MDTNISTRGNTDLKQVKPVGEIEIDIQAKPIYYRNQEHLKQLVEAQRIEMFRVARNQMIDYYGENYRESMLDRLVYDYVDLPLINGKSNYNYLMFIAGVISLVSGIYLY